MKRYTFRMEQVLRVRRLQEDVARSAVAGARRGELQAQEALDASTVRYQQLTAPGAALKTVDFLGLRDRTDHRAGAVQQSRVARSAATEATTAALHGWREAHNRVDALERLEGRRRDEHAVEVRRDEDLVADELVVARARKLS